MMGKHKAACGLALRVGLYAIVCTVVQTPGRGICKIIKFN